MQASGTGAVRPCVGNYGQRRDSALTAGEALEVMRFDVAAVADGA